MKKTLLTVALLTSVVAVASDVVAEEPTRVVVDANAELSFLSAEDLAYFNGLETAEAKAEFLAKARMAKNIVAESETATN